jgi:hypothetical protein
LVGNKHKKHKKHKRTLQTIERQRFAVLCFFYVWFYVLCGAKHKNPHSTSGGCGGGFLCYAGSVLCGGGAGLSQSKV